MFKRTLILIFSFTVLMPWNVQAFTIKLKDGRTIIGKLIKQTEKGVQLNVRGATFTYFSEEIESIEKEVDPLKEFQTMDDESPMELAERFVQLRPSEELSQQVKILADASKKPGMFDAIMAKVDIDALNKKRAEICAEILTKDELVFLIQTYKAPQWQSTRKKFAAQAGQYNAIYKQAAEEAYQKLRGIEK